MDPIPRRRRNSIQGFPPNLSEDHDRVLNCFQGKLTRGLSLKIYTAPDDELDGVIMAKRREVNAVFISSYKKSGGWFKEENPLIAGHLAEMCIIDRERELNCFKVIYTAPDDELDWVIMAKRRELIEETNKFYKEFEGWFKEENPLTAGHLAGFADKLDKVIMKAIVAKGSIVSSCLSECDRYLKRLRRAKEEILRRQERLMENIQGLFGLFQKEEKERLRREVKRFQVIFPAPDDELDGVFMAKRSGARRGSTNRLKSLYEYTASDSEQERYKMTPILLSELNRVLLAGFSIPSFVQLHRQANLSRSTPHSHALGGADTGEALLPPVLVSTLKDVMADLSLVGGGSLDETIRRILQEVLKDEVASELYWAGHGSKQCFQEANLQEVIFRASGKRYSGEAAFGDVWPHQHQHQLQLQHQHQQCMLVKAF